MSAIMYKNNVYGAGGASGGGGSSTLAGLSDVNLSSPTDGQVLVYDDTNDEWVNANPTGGASAVSDLTDVDLTNLANGQILKYNSTTQKWENANESGGGGGGYTRTELFKSSTTLAVWNASGITLSDDIENYDEIEFVLGFASGTDLSKRTNKFGAKWFADMFPYTSAVATVSHALLLLWPNQGFSAAWDSTNQKIMMWGRNGTAGMFAVYGIKY